MRWVTAHQNNLLIRDAADAAVGPALQGRAGFEASITPRAVHELLFRPAADDACPLFLALLAARAAAGGEDDGGGGGRSPRTLVWVDPAGTFYPPAVVAAGVSPGRVCVLRPRPADLLWATTEALRCPGIGAVVAPVVRPLTRVEVRRLQLAAEAGGGAAVLLRPNAARANVDVYAAATRWLVEPAPGEGVVQRWRLQLVHGHGRQDGHTFILERTRAPGQIRFMPLRPALVDRPAVQAS